jgi:hypothetical protein
MSLSYNGLDNVEYNSSSEDDEEKEMKRKKELVARWKQQALKRTNSHVYILTMEEKDHAMRGQEELKLIGAYDTKEAAVVASVAVDTSYGTFDSAIADIFTDDSDHVDNRENPPDDGILIQIGQEDVGEGDLVRLLIKKVDVLGVVKESYSSKEAPNNEKGQKKRRL